MDRFFILFFINDFDRFFRLPPLPDVILSETKFGPLAMLASGEFSHSESGKNDQFWFKDNSHT